jgi:hypothetical protein
VDSLVRLADDVAEEQPRLAAWRHGLDLAAVSATTGVEFAARMLGATLEAAAADPARRLCIDFAELPSAVWERVVPHFGLEADLAGIERMIEESQFYSKDAAPRVFVGDVPESRPMTDAMRQAAERFAEPAYRALTSQA